MANLKFRDRDAILAKEGLIFRVFGYSHPPDSLICDAEYASSEIFKSTNPKAIRTNGSQIFFKFYEDEGWKFIHENFRHYLIFNKMLGKNVVGVDAKDILESKKPETVLKSLVKSDPHDELLEAMQRVLELAMDHTGLATENFGVFGSILHGFYHPSFSDIDLIIYGKRQTHRLREVLQELYETNSSPLRNEFETDESIKGKRWRFQNLNPKEYLWHQRRKLIYALFNHGRSGRTIKTEFEPVKNWEEINNEYDSDTSISQLGWVRMAARILEDESAPFIPSIYGIEPIEVFEGAREALEVVRIISFVEEFRMQARRDETIYVEGNFEEVATSSGSFYQVALTYCPRYYEQVLKVVS